LARKDTDADLLGKTLAATGRNIGFTEVTTDITDRYWQPVTVGGVVGDGGNYARVRVRVKFRVRVSVRPIYTNLRLVVSVLTSVKPRC